MMLRSKNDSIDTVSISAAWRVLSRVLSLLLAACGSSSDDGLAEGLAGAAGSPAAGSGGTSAASGSGGTSGSGGSGGSGAGSPVTPVGDAGAGDCSPSIVESPPTSANHLTQCSAVSYDTNPPSGGSHYAIWAAYQSYDFPLPAGYLVHSLEHGAVVFWYNCPEGCPSEVAEVEAFIASLPEDPLCAGSGVARRAVLVPSPDLGSRWAASAWGFALSADCFDSNTFGQFYEEHYGRGPESLCNPPASTFTADPCL